MKTLQSIFLERIEMGTSEAEEAEKNIRIRLRTAIDELQKKVVYGSKIETLSDLQYMGYILETIEALPIEQLPQVNEDGKNEKRL